MIPNLSRQMRTVPAGVIPLSIVSFFLAFNYFVLKSLKETLLITAPEAGAEAIPFVKMWLLFPCSIVFLACFAWMAARFSLRFAVSFIILFFLGCYAFFGGVLYPQRDALHLHALGDRLQDLLPPGWKGFAAVVRYWSYAFFFVAAECWCTMIYSVVFWGYANSVMRLSDAKKYYPYLTLAGTLAALAAGPLILFLTGDWVKAVAPEAVDSWSFAFYILIVCVLACGGIAWGVFLRYCPEVPQEGASASKVSLWKAAGDLMKSRYLLTLAAVCLTYNLVMHLSDVAWKNQVLKLHPDPSHYTSYLSYTTLLTGLISTSLTLFVTRLSLSKLGWTGTALLTPLVALATGLAFFMSVYAQDSRLIEIPVFLIALLGSLHVCLSCGAKYTLFEPTKEMAFIPLSNEQKLHGKAAIDGLGARLGKTGSSLIYQALLVALPSVSACTPYIAVLMIFAISACMVSILSIGSKMEGEFLFQKNPS